MYEGLISQVMREGASMVLGALRRGAETMASWIITKLPRKDGDSGQGVAAVGILGAAALSAAPFFLIHAFVAGAVFGMVLRYLLTSWELTK